MSHKNIYSSSQDGLWGRYSVYVGSEELILPKMTYKYVVDYNLVVDGEEETQTIKRFASLAEAMEAAHGFEASAAAYAAKEKAHEGDEFRVDVRIVRRDSRGYTVGEVEYDFDGNALHECAKGITGESAEWFGADRYPEMERLAKKLADAELDTWADIDECEAVVETRWASEYEED